MMVFSRRGSACSMQPVLYARFASTQCVEVKTEPEGSSLKRAVVTASTATAG